MRAGTHLARLGDETADRIMCVGHALNLGVQMDGLFVCGTGRGVAEEGSNRRRVKVVHRHALLEAQTPVAVEVNVGFGVFCGLDAKASPRCRRLL